MQQRFRTGPPRDKSLCTLPSKSQITLLDVRILTHSRFQTLPPPWLWVFQASLLIRDGTADFKGVMMAFMGSLDSLASSTVAPQECSENPKAAAPAKLMRRLLRRHGGRSSRGHGRRRDESKGGVP